MFRDSSRTVFYRAGFVNRVVGVKGGWRAVGLKLHLKFGSFQLNHPLLLTDSTTEELQQKQDVHQPGGVKGKPPFLNLSGFNVYQRK